MSHVAQEQAHVCGPKNARLGQTPSVADFRVHHPTVAVLIGQNLLHNLGVLRARARGAKILAMVKCQAYGHGLVEVARRLADPGAFGRGDIQPADFLGVACLDEAVALRRAGIKAPVVLAQGVHDGDEMAGAAALGCEVVVHHPQHVAWVREVGGRPLRVWVKVDTGMGRLGLAGPQIPEVVAALRQCDHVDPRITLMSHLGCADMRDHPINQQQLDSFAQVVAQGWAERHSLLNSAGIFHFPDHAYDIVRPGLALYGISPVEGAVGADWGLRPVMSLRSRLTHVAWRSQGSCVGYAGAFVCPQDMPVGIVPFGYGDGAPLGIREAGILIDGAMCPIIGRVSMDMMAVDLRPAWDVLGENAVKLGHPVEIWGGQQPVEHFASATTQLVWSHVTSLGSRIRRSWADSA